MLEESLVQELRALGSPHAETIAVGLSNGSMQIDAQTIPASVRELLGTYKVRRVHLSMLDSDHARDLARDVGTLCEQLESAAIETCQSVSIRTSSPGESYLIFRDSLNARVLGCCHVFSKLDVSPDEWRKLWNE